MKHNKLHCVAHNFADSLAMGLSFVVPQLVIHTNVYAEMAANEDGFLIAEFWPERLMEFTPTAKLNTPFLCLKTLFLNLQQTWR